MFYFIECDDDNSYCVVEDFCVICDPDNPPIVSAKVVFYWADDKCTGIVVDISDNADELKASAKKLKFKTKNFDRTNDSPLPSKRPHKPKKNWSFEDDKNPPPKKKKTDTTKSNNKESSTNLKRQVKSLIDQKESTSDKKNKDKASKQNSQTSPSKEELKLMIEKQQKLLTSLTNSKSKSNNLASTANKIPENCIIPDTDDDDDDNDDDDDDDDDDADVDDNNEKNKNKSEEKEKQKDNNDMFVMSEVEEGSHRDGDKNFRHPQHDDDIQLHTVNGNNLQNESPQLYGLNSGEQMILLNDNIYWKKAAFDDAVDFSRKSATSFLRQIMNGVFKRSAILNCTYSGRPPNAQGKARQSHKVQPLDRTAKKVVLEYCAKYANKKGWPASSDAELRKAMTQWVGEIKRENNKNLQSSE